MKKESIVLLFAFSWLGASAQFELPVYFEDQEEFATWHQFSNGENATENFILTGNPDKSAVNPSDSCIQFTVLDNADPWVGAYSDAYGEIAITEENCILQMMVYKDVISDCCLKLEGIDNWEVKVPNTETGIWQLLSFDFYDVTGKTYTRLTFFPDFPATRTAGSLCYIDNIGFFGTFNFNTSVKEKSLLNFRIYPNPAKERIVVQSEGITRIAITNLTGQNVKSFQFQKSDYAVLDVSELVRGIYFITVESSTGTVSSKFVKE